jgi:hypothetical protein
MFLCKDWADFSAPGAPFDGRLMAQYQRLHHKIAAGKAANVKSARLTAASKIQEPEP